MPNPFFDTPKTRRLKRDLEEMRLLKQQSSIMDFRAEGDAPDTYSITFRGKGLASPDEETDIHRVTVNLGVEYPRMLPSITWETPILHPNISGKRPCFGTFIMNPNVRLVDIVEILWDMARLSTYNPYGGYGDKDQWQVLRRQYDFPVDKRLLRDKIPQADRPEEGEGPAELIIMGYSMGAGLPASQVWVQMALSQFFENRGLRDRVEILTGDEWAASGRPRYDDLVGGLILDDELYEFTQSGSEEAEAFNEQLWYVFRKLGVLPNSGLGNVWPLLPMLKMGV